MVFFTSMLSAEEQVRLRGWLRESVVECGADVARALEPALAGFEDVMDGEDFNEEGISTHGRRLLGWSASGHWLRHGFGDRPRAAYQSS